MVACAAICAADDERARWLAGPARLSMARLRSGRPTRFPTPEEAAEHEFTEAEEQSISSLSGSAVIGGPDTVRDGSTRSPSAPAADELMITTMVHDHADRIRSYELIADLYELPGAPVAAGGGTEDPMTTKAEFNAEEWEQIAGGPALAGLIVISAQRGGTIRETVAMAKVYNETARAARRLRPGRRDRRDNAEHRPRSEFRSKEDLRTRGLGKITEAVDLVESKATPEELAAYRAFAITVAQRAAEADKSGGFLGIGGERVSDSERTALNDVAAALGTEAPSEATAPAPADPPAGDAPAEDPPAA